MKQYASVALLALKRSWKAAVLIFLAVCAVQTFAVYNWLMPDGVPLQATFGFETMLESAVDPHGRTGFAALVLVLTVAMGEGKGTKSVYTLRRLGISEMQATLTIGAVYSSYFILFWLFQLGLCFAFFAWYTHFSLVSANALMLAAWRSGWFHLLLPLAEWSGYLRNFALCLGFGCSAAFGAHQLRHKRNALGSGVLVALCLFCLPTRPATLGMDIALAALTAVIVTVLFLTVRGGDRDEEVL